MENNSEREDTFAYYDKITERYPGVRVIVWEKEFNYSAINNFAAGAGRGRISPLSEQRRGDPHATVMEEMLMICQQDQVAVTGAKLYYPDDTIQHAGVVLGTGRDSPDISCAGGASREDAGYFGRMISVPGDQARWTAACMLGEKIGFSGCGRL